MPSPQRGKSKIQLKSKTYARLTGVLNTRYPGLKEGEERTIFSSNRCFRVKADGYGGMEVLDVHKIK